MILLASSSLKGIVLAKRVKKQTKNPMIAPKLVLASCIPPAARTILSLHVLPIGMIRKIRRTLPPIGVAILLLIDKRPAIIPPKLRQLRAIQTAREKDSKTTCRLGRESIIAQIILDRVQSWARVEWKSRNCVGAVILVLIKFLLPLLWRIDGAAGL